jgi:hypothetical protein
LRRCEQNKVNAALAFLLRFTAKVFDNQDIAQVAPPVHRLG